LARRGVEEEDVTFKSCAKGDSEVTELLRRPEMGCDGAAADKNVYFFLFVRNEKFSPSNLWNNKLIPLIIEYQLI